MLFIFLLSFLLTIQDVPSADAADTFYNGGAGATGVREMPLFIAKDLKIFGGAGAGGQRGPRIPYQARS